MHISRIGRNSAKVRLGLAALYLMLSLGAVTTLYPFLLMLSTATKSQSDFNDYSPARLIPAYWHDDAALYVKYLEDRYANNLDELNAAHHADYKKVAEAPLPTEATSTLQEWESFSQAFPENLLRAGFGEHENAPTPLLMRFRDWLKQKYNNDIDAVNKAWREENIRFETITAPIEKPALRAWMPQASRPKVRDWFEFRRSLPKNYLVPTFGDALWRKYLKEDIYQGKLDDLNAAWKTTLPDWTALTLPTRAPQGLSYKDWEAFMRTKFPLRMLSVDASAAPAWQAFLTKRKRPQIPLPTAPPADGITLTDWMEFVKTDAPVSAFAAQAPENLWRAKLGSPDAQPPQAALDLAYVKAHGPELRRDFATRNFIHVYRQLMTGGQSGRTLFNTIVFCMLSILGALIVNPLCAYALSRYPLPYAYKVLLFVLATMAFPAEVAMIPNFLMLKSMGLLNTFGALILPGLASGYSIFLLKGFFDSLPKELYEAGILDGASELEMFARITLPLSLPIFSVIALNAFTGAYGAFLFALVVCQDPKMWTIMVALYNLQSNAPQYVIFAALTLAALPTLLVFLAAQKVILRGIVLPSFK
jgi:ABC-type glycerol-3-phosphate transport system permease component